MASTLSILWLRLWQLLLYILCFCCRVKIRWRYPPGADIVITCSAMIVKIDRTLKMCRIKIQLYLGKSGGGEEQLLHHWTSL